jgi:hypothetical protein
MCALKRIIAEAEEGGATDPAAAQQLPQQEGQGAVVVTERDFLDALGSLTPSLSQEELARYLALKAHYDSQQGTAVARA